jgi:hypothetical protein
VLAQRPVDLIMVNRKLDRDYTDGLDVLPELLRAAREGWKIVQSYADHAISGASLMRPGIQALMQDAQG